MPKLPDTRRLMAPSAPFFASLPPLAAAYFRGFAALLLVGAIEAAIHYLQVGPALPTAWEFAVPVVILLLRTVEGYVDHHSTVIAAQAPPMPPAPPVPATGTATGTHPAIDEVNP